jgi:hypothetical protein
MEEYQLPESLYGLTVAEPLQLQKAVDGSFIYYTEYIRSYALLFVNYGVQGLFLWHFAKINGDNAEEMAGCDSEFDVLKVSSIFVFNVSAFLELRKIRNMYKGIWACPTGGKGAFAVVAGDTHGGVLEAEAKSASNPFAGMMIWGANRALGTEWSLDNMTFSYKVVVGVLIIIPRTALALGVMWIGAVYVMQSSDAETIMLNTLAVLFVLDVDNFFYDAFTATHMKMQLTTVPGIALEPGKWEHLFSFFNSLIGYPLLVTCATFCLFFLHKSNCGGQ